MGFEGYTNDVLQAAVKHLSDEGEFTSYFFSADDYDEWKKNRQHLDEEEIDESEISAGDFTEAIRSVVPSYSGVQAKNWSGKEARMAIMDALYEYHLSEMSYRSRKVWTEDAIGLYARLILGKKDDISALAGNKTPEEKLRKDRFDIHIEVLDNLKAKVNAGILINDMLNADSKTFIRNWTTYMAVISMPSLDEHLRIYDGDPDAEAKKQKLNEYKETLDRIQAIRPEIEARMELLASNFSEKIDVDKLAEMSTSQLKAIQAQMEYNEYVEYDPFGQALKLNEKRLERQKKEIAGELFNNDAELLAYDINGKPGDIDEMLQSGLPVVIGSKAVKDKSRLVFRDGAALYYGDDASAKFLEKRNAALKGRPRGFGWLWDKFCSAVGREDWQTEAAKNYHKYERMLAEHPDIEEKLSDPAKAELAAAVAGRGKNTSQKENAAQEVAPAEEKQLTQEKNERERLKENVKIYLRDQRKYYENTLAPQKVLTYLAYKSLSDIMDKFENDAASLSPEEQKAIGDVLLTENYVKEINNFIKQRSEVAENDPVCKAGLEEMEELYQENSWDNDDLLPMADKMAGIDAFKLTVPGKTKEEYDAELFYSVNELDEGVRNTVKSLSENLKKQAEDLLSKNDMTRRDQCRAAIITHIVHEIREGFEHTKKYVGLDAEFKAVVDLARADENCSEKLNDFIDSRVDMMELTAEFNKLAADPEKPGKVRLEAMEGNELKEVLAANLKDEVADSELEKFLVIKNDNKFEKMLSSNDINKCVELHNNLKEAGLSEKDRLVMEDYIGEIRKTLNGKYPDISQNLSKGKGLLRNQKANYMSYVEIRRGAEESLKTINSIANGEAIDKEKVKQVKSIENQIIKNKDGLEEKRRIIEDALKKSDILASMPTEKLLSVFYGKENNDSNEIRKDLERIRKADEEAKARQAAEEAKRNETKKLDESKKAAHII